MHPQISVNIRSLCGESKCILSLQVAARQQHIAGSGKTFRGHVYVPLSLTSNEPLIETRFKLTPPSQL